MRIGRYFDVIHDFRRHRIDHANVIVVAIRHIDVIRRAGKRHKRQEKQQCSHKSENSEMNARLLVAALAASAALAQVPHPALLVLNKAANELAVVDPATGKIAGRVRVGESPHEITVSADGRYAFVTNYGAQNPGETLSMIDIPAIKELRRVKLGPLRKPHGIFFAGGSVYFTAENNCAIARYDPQGDQVDWLLGTGQIGTHMVSLNKEMNRMFTANIGSGTVTILERANSPVGWNATIVPVGKGPEGNDLSHDEKELWVANGQGGTVSIVDIAAKKVIDTIDVQTKRSNRLTFTPDGKHVFISDMTGNEVIVLDAATHKQVKRISPGKSPEGILMQPDGSRVYVALAGDNEVAVIDPKTLDVVKRIPTGSGPDGLAWVP
jgi:YVTN family beta-propeller protein